MENKPEVLKIIEAGLEGDIVKVRAYANLLVGKSSDDERFQSAIIDRLTGEYKRKDVLSLLSKRDNRGQSVTAARRAVDSQEGDSTSPVSDQ